MPKRKLTPKLREYLQANRFKVKQSDYSGEALEYLLRSRKAAKAAKKRKENTAKVGKVVIPRNSELYEVIETSARIKKQTVAGFIKKNKKAIQELMTDGRIVMQRETSYLINDINKLPKRNKVFINEVETGRGDAIYIIQNFTSQAMQYTSTVVVMYEVAYDLTGNMYINIPQLDEFDELIEMLEDGEMDEEDNELMEFLNDMEGIVVVSSPKKSSK